MALSNRYIAFIDSYMINGFNATNAYRTAYPNASEETANKNVSKILNRPEVKQEIERRQEEHRKKYDVTKEEVVEVVKDIMMNNRKDAPPYSLKAAEIICKMFGFNAADKQEIVTSTPEDNTIKIEIIRPKDGN